MWCHPVTPPFRVASLRRQANAPPGCYYGLSTLSLTPHLKGTALVVLLSCSLFLLILFFLLFFIMLSFTENCVSRISNAVLLCCISYAAKKKNSAFPKRNYRL